jgi:hypothetical protein
MGIFNGKQRNYIYFPQGAMLTILKYCQLEGCDLPHKPRYIAHASDIMEFDGDLFISHKYLRQPKENYG